MNLIKNNEIKVAVKFCLEDIKDGLSFFSDDQDYIQIGTWKYNRGKNLLAHIHNYVKREVNRTQEFLFVVKGSVRATIFDENAKSIESLVLNVNEGLILFAGGHGYEILDDDTIVIEVKNGPYPGADLDRRRI